MVSEAKTAFPTYAVEKVSLSTYTTRGAKIFWKLERNVLQEILPLTPVPMKWFTSKKTNI
jgi:hypothetical protein